MSGSSSEPHGPAPLGCQRAWRRAVSVPALPKAKQFVVCDPHSLSFFQNITKLRTAPPQPPGRQKGFCSRAAPAPVQLRVQGCRTGVPTPTTCTIHHTRAGTWAPPVPPHGSKGLLLSSSAHPGAWAVLKRAQWGPVGKWGPFPVRVPIHSVLPSPSSPPAGVCPRGGAEALTQLEGRWPQRMGSLR